ncbi:exonuclease SbcCD subunit D [Catenisphaera adipataccumulans]|jgi:exonuclease SbcD|uniref:Nuclease SbcCD subunit D n=1 Tax=Catenisphaera adipataccumulans TaxID=700500 RepID=A0A7W8FU90_9FIRM|nr:exonuclease SbcCD subunit D [Catenisphaera adipataccumulans]MBB5182349.1 exonuclease SbcD [Catenisphaera adipataccumulans]
MKLFHLSDLHIGLKLMSYDLQDDQQYIFTQIAQYAQQECPDVILIAGDIYDKAMPPAKAVDLFNDFVRLLQEACPQAVLMMISGNHDSAARINSFRPVLQKQNIYMIGKPPMHEGESIEKIVLHDAYGPVNFYLLPFVKPSMVREIVGEGRTYQEAVNELIQKAAIDLKQRNVLVSHQFYLPFGMPAEAVERADSEMRTVGNIDAIAGHILQAFDVAALGHIHKPMRLGDDCHRYCGSPLAASVSEAGQQKGIVVYDLQEKGQISVSVLPLHPLRQVRVLSGSVESLEAQASDDYVSLIVERALDVDEQARLRQAFPHLLEIRRTDPPHLYRPIHSRPEIDPFELVCDFLPDLDEAEKEILKDVYNTVQEENT